MQLQIREISRDTIRDDRDRDRDRGRMSDRRGGYRDRRDEPARPNTNQDWRKRDPPQDSPRDPPKRELVYIKKI